MTFQSESVLFLFLVLIDVSMLISYILNMVIITLHLLNISMRIFTVSKSMTVYSWTCHCLDVLFIVVYAETSLLLVCAVQ